MNLEPGRTLLHYRIVDKLGEGGMGVVWKAVDTSLDREVAIKVVPDLFAGDAERLARFEREAKLLASLDHPNIATVYGLHETEGIRFFAMELVEGEDLSERLVRGPLSLDETISLARQIASALESAHESGVIHRDLKPANIKIGSSGKVKVLDFGLAKAFEPDPASGSAGLSQSPTLTSAGTRAGVILGTAAYMSPEQARGHAVDQRTDVWSFGCVLHEMLTGRSVFGEKTVSDSIAAILRGEPDWTSLPPGTPRAIRRLLVRCLAKSPGHRLRHIGDAILEIDVAEEDSLSGGEFVEPVGPLEKRGAPAQATTARSLVPWVLLALLLAIVFWGPWRKAPPQDDEIPLRLSVSLPADAPLAPAGAMPFGVGVPSFATSPDGTWLVYVGLVEGRRQLHVREMTSGEVTPLAGTEDGYGPFVSPDGKSVGYFVREKLARVSLDGGQPEILADAVFPFGGVWAPDGRIYFVPREGYGISAVPATGGPVVEITKRTGDAQAWPQVLPGGEMLLVSGSSGSTRIVPLADPEQSRVLIPHGVDARWVSTGHLLYSRAGRLQAVPFDLDDYTIAGDPVTLLDDIRTESTFVGQYSLTEEGTLIYAAGLDARTGYLAWADRDGGFQRLDLPRREYGAFELSHDGKRVALPIADGDGMDIWIYDFDRLKRPTRFTFGGKSWWPVWGGDDDRLFYGSRMQDNRNDIVTQPLAGSEGDGLSLVTGTPSAHPGTVTPDGREFVFGQTSEQNWLDLWRAPIEFDGNNVTLGEPVLLAGTPYLEIFPSISPDGDWIAYTTDETGRWEVYVADYPGLERRVRVSSDGGEEPRFSPDGSELIYRWGSRWFASDLTYEPDLHCDSPRVIFEGPFLNVSGYSWDIAADGQRFLVIEGPEQNEARTELVVLTDFLDRLR